MHYYLFFIASCCFLGAVALLFSRARFYFQAVRVPGKVIDLVTRNHSAENAGGKSKHLLIEYCDEHQKLQQHLCNDSVITAFYKIGDDVVLLQQGARILLNNALHLVLPSLVLLLLACGALIAGLQILNG